MRVEAFGLTEQGPVRASHQDAIVLAGRVGLASGASLDLSRLAGAEDTVIAVVDGMGGHAGGEDAAALVASAIAALRGAPGEGWAAWCERLSDKVAAAGAAWGSADMGATMAALLVSGGRAVAVNLGDCRIYRVRDGYVGRVSVEDRGFAGGRPVVTQSLGGPARALDPHELALELGGSGRFVLCTDGLFGALGDERLAEMLACGSADRPEQLVEATIIAALAAPECDDNVSMMVVDVSSEEGL